MDRLRFFQGFIILLALTFLLAGGSLLNESVSHPDPWSLLGGGLLCSLAVIFVYFLWKQHARGKYL
jgi:uncharacterized membrane protein YdcZ (DUF606 family)